MPDEEDRTAVHECGHSLCDLLFLGWPGRIELSADGRSGTTKAAFLDDLRLALDDDGAYHLYRAHASLASVAAEEEAYGYACESGNGEDRTNFRDAVKALRDLGVVTERKIRATTAYLMRTHRKVLLAMSGTLMWGHTTLGKALFDAACVRDPALIASSDDPILNAKADWRRKWAALKDAAGDDQAVRTPAGALPREYWGVAMDEQTRRLLSD
jgi:hypothetical protein